MKHWSTEEVNRLKTLYPTMTAAQLGRHFGRSERAVHLKCRRLGLLKGRGHARIILSDADRLWFRLNFPHMRTQLCALRLGVSPRTCVRWAREMGIWKTPQFMKESQAFTSRKAQESHIRNGTYPAKGYYSPNLRMGERYKFKSKTRPQ